ncbi:methyltransferase-like protein 22 [Diretmus argenteus]
MDQITFHYDTVLSDVHLLLPNTRHLMTHLNRMGQPVFVSKFKILRDAEGGEDGGGEGGVDPVLDEDGDLEVTRRPRTSRPEDRRDKVCPIIISQCTTVQEEEEEEDDSKEDEDDEDFKYILRIEHTMATPLEDVGKQVWRGALLLADFILSHPIMFRGATVLELGAGTGLASVVMATVAKVVYCTDVGEDLLSMCQRNVTLNKDLLELAGGDVRVRQLDWLQHDLCTDADVEFSWTEEEVACIYDNTSFIMAADVCYDDDLTDGLFRTLYHLCSNLAQPCITYLSIEKRLNFTLRHMDVSCEAYDHFCRCLSRLQDAVDGRCSFQVEQLATTFPQRLQYERIEQLELWKVTATPLHLKQTPPDSDPAPS